MANRTATRKRGGRRSRNGDKPSKPEQPSFELGKRPRWKNGALSLDQIVVGHFGAPPDKALLDSVALHGVLVPLLVQPTEVEDVYKLDDGRRRLKAAHDVGLKTVPVRIMVDGNPDLYGPAASLGANTPRSANPIVELDAIEHLMVKAGGSITPAQLGKALALPVKTIKDRLKLTQLDTRLRDAGREGAFGAKVAEAAAKLNQIQQNELVAKMEEGGGHLTYNDVLAVKKSHVAGHQRTLPGDNTAKRIRDWLTKARKDAFLEWGEGDVTTAIDGALEAIERASSEE